jgi:hypothetical protein
MVHTLPRARLTIALQLVRHLQGPSPARFALSMIDAAMAKATDRYSVKHQPSNRTPLFEIVIGPGSKAVETLHAVSFLQH